MPSDPVASERPPGRDTGSQWKLCPRCHKIYPAAEERCLHDQEALSPDDRILAGKFLLLRKIGEGGMGEVYEAEQPQIGRTVAIKVLRSDPETMRRFESEAKAVGAINHPNVVTIYDSGITPDGRGFIAMEYLDGESLARLLEREGTLPPAHALTLWTQAVRAMAAAHGKGIIHRDLKPENIFISRRHSDEGDETAVKVLDFGIAKLQKQPQEFKGTTPGILVGTMQYMSPEQLERKELSAHSDVYSLGLILVEMLSGRLPWGKTKEQSYSLYQLRLLNPPIPLQQLCPEQSFSSELQELLKDMLAYEVPKRLGSCREVVRRLKAVPEVNAAVQPEQRDASTFTPSGVSFKPGAQQALERAAPPGALAATGPSTLNVLVQHDTEPEPHVATRMRQNQPAPPPRLRRLGIVGFGAVLLLAGSGLLFWRLREPHPVAPVTVPPLKVEQPPPPPPPPPPPEKQTDPGPVRPVTHRPAHAAPILVQFAFTDAAGIRLSCGGKKLGAPDCSAGGLCKSVGVVSQGQKCVAEKNSERKAFPYAELQKHPADRKNVVHVLVRF